MLRSVLFVLLLSFPMTGFTSVDRPFSVPQEVGSSDPELSTATQEIYASGAVVQINGILYDKNSHEKIDGRVESYSDSDVLLQELVCVDGRPHGITKDYYDSGALKSEISYRHGLYDGLSKFYYETGGLEFEVPSRNDLVHGTMIRYNQDGSIASQECYVDGVLQEE